MIVYAFIFARGGSKGLTNKNFRELNGKPLIAHAIEKAKAYDKINEVFVSTDNKTIKEIALDWDAQVIDRPTELAQDNTPEWLAWRHAVNYLENNKKKFDIFMSLPTTAPLRSLEDMRNCIDAFGEDTDIVVTMRQAERNPWFNMVKQTNDGYLKLVNNSINDISRRQDSPIVYDLTTVAYVTTPKFIFNNNGVFDGRVKGVEVPKERSLDIDTEYDFKLAELIFRNPSFLKKS
tara:strand:+ start:3551 stop:4252 length:702 start_codon:yes stop_codon:yes gene_type:complete